MTSVTHHECCSIKGERTEQCRQGERCACLKRIPMHLRTDRIIFSRSNPASNPTKISFGSEKKVCLHDENRTNTLFSTNTCTDYGILEEPIECTQKPYVKCRISGSEHDKTRPPVRLGPALPGDWTRFDVTSDIPGESTFLPLESYSAVRSVADCNESEQVEEEAIEKCRCDKPFCRGCKLVESSSESLEEVLVEKSVSFDDEILDAVDSDMWLNPVAHKKVLQFTSPVAREKYKKEMLKRLTHTASTTPRSEWIHHIQEFDHYVTIIMGESSSSSSDYGDSDIKLERKAIRKQRRKKRLMYSVENMKEHPVYNCSYNRQYLNFMEDLKKRAAQPPKYEWPRFMKTFSGYGKDSSEEVDPEWMGLLMMAPKECFREISSSSSCESLPHLSDPGSTTTSLSSSECSPSACGRDSTELLKRAGVCVAHDWKNDVSRHENENSKIEDNSKSEIQDMTQESNIAMRLDSEVEVGSFDKVLSNPKSLPSSSDMLSSLNLNKQPSLTSETLQRISSKAAPTEIETSSSKTVPTTRESLAAQASVMLQSLQSNRQVRLQSASKKLKAELLSEEDEIVVIQEEQLPTTLGMKPRLHGEGLFDDQVQPEFQTTRRNVIVILHGKLHKLNYECYCGDICNCNPKQLVEKYMDMLIDEVYNSPNFDNDEEEDIEFNKEEQDSVGDQVDGILVSEPQGSAIAIKEEDEQNYNMCSEAKVSTKIDHSRAFLRGLHVDPSPKDTPHLPAGKFDKRDVTDTKTVPEGILAYKDFHPKGELRGANKCQKKTKQGTPSSKEMALSEPGSEASDSEKHDSQSDDGVESSSANVSMSTNNSSDSSSPLCACCKCEKRYDANGKIYRRCDKTRCTCCNCKEKIIKVAKKIYARKKGSRFLYVVLKKIRRAINQPSKQNRENYLQSIVNELREEGKRVPKKKWPYYFKESGYQIKRRGLSMQTARGQGASLRREGG